MVPKDFIIYWPNQYTTSIYVIFLYCCDLLFSLYYIAFHSLII